MPAIPQYREQVSASSAGPGPGPLGDRSGDLLIQAGEEAQRNLDRQRHAELTRTVTQNASQLRLASEQDFLAAQSNANSPDGFTPAALKSFDDRRTEIASKITDRGMRNAFIEYADQNIRIDLASRAMKWEAEQGLAVRVTKAQESLEHATAAVELAPDSWMQAGGEQLRQIDNLGLEPAAREQARVQATDSIRYAAARGFAKLDPATALKTLGSTESGNPAFDQLSPRQRHELEQYSKSRLAEVSADQVVSAYRTDARAGMKALSALAASDLPQDVKNAAASQAREGVGALHFERRQEFGEQVTALERSITQGTPAINAEQSAAALYRRGAYTAEQYTNVLQAIDAARIQAAKSGAEIVTVQEAILTGQRLDPKNEKIVSAVDKWFINATKVNGIQPGTDEYTNSAASIAARTNILPPEAMSWARKTLLSGEPAASVQAANAMQRFADAAPVAWSYFDDPNVKSVASQVDAMTRAGASPAKAVEMARANTFDIPKARQESLDTKWKKQKYGEDNAGELQGLLNTDDAFETTFFGKAPAPPLTMQDEYNQLVRNYFNHNNGDITEARKTAWKDLRGTYGISQINGEPEVMKYAPELVFPGLDSKVVRADIDEVAKSLGVSTPVRMVPSRTTGDTKGLVWELHTTDADGAEEVLLDEKNRPRQYMIPTDTERYIAAQELAKKAAVDEALAERERRRMTQEAAEKLDPLEPGF